MPASCTETFQIIKDDGQSGGCDCDTNHDGVVDLADLSHLLACFGTASGMTCAEGDLDGDGDVDLDDLSQMLICFGGQPAEELALKAWVRCSILRPHAGVFFRPGRCMGLASDNRERPSPRLQ